MRVNLGVDMQSDVLCLLLSILVSINHKQLEILPVLKDTSICTLTDASTAEPAVAPLPPSAHWPWRQP